MNSAIIGALINSALYLLCVFVAGLVMGHPAAWKLAIMAMGVTFLVYAVQLSPPVSKAKEDLRAAVLTSLVPISWSLGAFAGIFLLF